jgi:integrase
VNTKAGAAEYEALLRLRLTRGEPIEATPHPAAPRFSEFTSEWFDTYVRTNNKPSSQRTKECLLRKHLIPAFGARSLDEIGAKEVEQYKAVKLAGGLHPKSVNDHLTVLRRCLRMAEEWGLIDHAPRIRPLRSPPPEIDFLSPAESEKLVADSTEPAWDGMILVALHAGLRLGELFALETRDVDLDRKILRVARAYANRVLGTPKSNRPRYIPMTTGLCEFFSRPRPAGLVFGPRAYSSASKAIARISARAGLRRIGWHTLRHTFASTLVAAGVSLPAIQALMGHSTISTTMRYAHLGPSALRGAMDAFDGFTKRHDFAPSEFGHQVGTSPPTEAFGAPDLLAELSQFAA